VRKLEPEVSAKPVPPFPFKTIDLLPTEEAKSRLKLVWEQCLVRRKESKASSSTAATTATASIDYCSTVTL
jgi:hypothetical protein